MARALGEILELPVLELDEAHWGPQWTPRSDAAIQARIDEVMAHDRWVIDGNYSRFQPGIWDRADTVVWLDHSFPRLFGRLIRRTARRTLQREPLWAGNRETVRVALASRDSILWWQIKTFLPNRRRYSRRLADPRWAHLRAVRLRRPSDEARFLAGLRTS